MFHCDDKFVSCVFDLMARIDAASWLIENHIEQNESNFRILFSLADNMKRESEENIDQQMQQQQQQPQQQMQEEFDENTQDHGTDNDDSQDDTNETNNFNNQNNQSQDNGGGPNPAKRQRRNDDEEVRLLIPSKVRDFSFVLILIQYV